MKKISFIIGILIIGIQTSARNIRIQSFETTHNTTYITTEDALLHDQPFQKQTEGRLYFYGDYTLLRDPWIDLDDSGDNYLSTLIAQSQTLNLGLGWLASENLQAGFELPVEMIKTENYPAVNSALDGSSATGLGDTRLYAKWKFYQSESKWAMALQPTIYLPTGMRTVNGYSATATSSVKTGIGSSWGAIGAGLKLNLEKQFESFLIAANVGLEYHPDSMIEGQRSVFTGTAEYPKVDLSTLYVAQLALFFPLTQKWGVNLETGGKFSGKHNEYTQPGESYAGLRYQWSKDISVHAGYGGSAGFKNGVGERYLVGIKMPVFMPGSAAKAEPPPAPKPKKVVYTSQKLEISQSIEFESGKDTLTQQGQEILDEVAEVLLEKKDSLASVIAEGHTDFQGSMVLNQNLSERRARTAKNYLIEKGVSAAILSSRGFGETKPIFPGENITAEQMLKNRRVEFLIKEKTRPNSGD